jgi:hypothetical protein
VAWQTVKGLKGKVYVPERCPEPKKHSCPDCFACQWCSDERCTMCRLARSDGRSCLHEKPCTSSKEN